MEALRVANLGKACAGKINYKDQCLESFISKDDDAAVTSVPELLPPALYQHEILGQYH